MSKPKQLSESLHSQCSEYVIRLVNEYSDCLMVARKFTDTSLPGNSKGYQMQLLDDYDEKPRMVWRMDNAEQADELIALLQRVRDDVFGK